MSCEKNCHYCYPTVYSSEICVCNVFEGLDEIVCRVLAERTGEFPPKDQDKLQDLQEKAHDDLQRLMEERL